MKKILYIVALAAVMSSCSDKIYQEINTDPAKAETMNPTLQLTYAELEIFGDMNYVDVHRLYVYAFTQQLMGCWNTTYYGGQQRVDDNEMSRPWNNLYAGAIRNLTDGLAHCNGNADMANIEAALRIFRVYVISLLTDYYGDVPDSEAGLAYQTGNSKPRYDTQEEIYHRFFTELKTAVDMFDPQAKSPCSAEMSDHGNALPIRCACALQCVLRTVCPNWRNRSS